RHPAVWDYFLEQEQGVYIADEFDGPELVICGYHNISMISADSKKPAEIVCEPRYASVLTFSGCEGVTLSGLSIGHTPEAGYCAGEVLTYESCTNVRIDRSELYGCGTYGFYMSDCENVEVTGCEIHDCTYGCAEIHQTQALRVVHTDFHDCREFTMFEVSGSTVDFIGCSFKNLNGNLVGLSYSDVNFIACDLEPWMQKELIDKGILSESEITKEPEKEAEPVKAEEPVEEEAESEPAEPLTEKELKELSKELSSDYNGFFCSTYTRPEEIILDELFYNGAGIEVDIYSEENKEILDAYLSAEGLESKEEMMTDVTVIAEADMDEYLQKTTGLTYFDMWNPIRWRYLSVGDGYYYFAHGDTNYRPVDFYEGTISGDVYCLQYHGWDYCYNDRDYVAKIEKTKDGYHFIYNVPLDYTVNGEPGVIRADLPIAGFYGGPIRDYVSTLQWEPSLDELYDKGLPGTLHDLFADVTYEDGPGAVLDQIGLYFKDLNDDGFDELIIGTNYGSGAYDNIHQIYTKLDGRPLCVFDEPYRGEMVLTADGQVAEQFAPSLYYFEKDRYVLDPEYSTFRLSDGVYFEDISDWESEEPVFAYYAFNGYDEEGCVVWKEITEEEFDAFDVMQGAIRIPYQLTMDEAEPAGAKQTEDGHLNYKDDIGEPNEALSWYDEDTKNYVDAYVMDGAADVRIGRLAWLESIDDIEKVLKEQLKDTPRDISLQKLNEDVVKSLYHTDCSVYKISYYTGKNEDNKENYDMVFMAPEALYWFHIGLPGDMADRYYLEMVDEMQTELEVQKLPPTGEFLGEHSNEGVG
ncbi:MAG: right-handed parallel beta-helix repeat-containing protein, partial [Lachnospiraceae bacterium]|nr:right-handed parallel beta-helix repeat-containing protein [Lachnospiraceae bacterium]